MGERRNLDLYIIGNNIRDLREQKQLTKMKVVNDLGISYTHYAKIEEGMRNMIVFTTEQIADIHLTPEVVVLVLRQVSGGLVI